MLAEAGFADVPDPEVIVFPGGYGTRALMEHEPTLDWLRRAHEDSDWTTSVCTGALVLGAAGILDGLEATTHWLERETLAGLGATPVERSVVEQGKVITAAGVSSGIDMALTLAAPNRGRGCGQGHPARASSTTPSRRSTPGPRRRRRLSWSSWSVT